MTPRPEEPRTFTPDPTLAAIRRAEDRLKEAEHLGIGIEEAREVYAAAVATAATKSMGA